jgi:paired amphipathic helix protein Sin3a
VYENFLRCLNLYCHEIINREELVELVSGFLSKFPSLLQWFKNYVGVQDRVGALGQQADIQPDLDLRTCKQLDRSYRQLPDP